MWKQCSYCMWYFCNAVTTYLILLMQKLYMRSACRFIQKCPRKTSEQRTPFCQAAYYIWFVVWWFALYSSIPSHLVWSEPTWCPDDDGGWYSVDVYRLWIMYVYIYIYMLWIIHMPEVYIYIYCRYIYRYKGSKYGTDCSSLRLQVTSSEVCAMFLRSTFGICVSEQRHRLGFDMADKKTPLGKYEHIVYMCGIRYLCFYQF